MNKVSVYGGLGNQMFQYALSIALNQKGKKARISISGFFYDYHHNGFNLTDAFKLKLPVILRLQNILLKYGRIFYKNKPAAVLLKKLIDSYHTFFYNVYREKREFEYDTEIFKQHSDYFVGVWQVELYFKNIRNIILDVFDFNEPKDKINLALIEKIRNCNSVSLHIRRGDYYTEKWEKALTVIKDNSYYYRAIDHINSKIESPHFFIFSDDIKWVKNNLSINNCTYIDHNTGKNSFIDMYLMSLCRHNIIANSSFSWWGAWLNKNQDKLVIMPEKWFNRDFCEGIFPSEWIKFNV